VNCLAWAHTVSASEKSTIAILRSRI